MYHKIYCSNTQFDIFSNLKCYNLSNLLNMQHNTIPFRKLIEGIKLSILNHIELLDIQKCNFIHFELIMVHKLLRINDWLNLIIQNHMKFHIHYHSNKIPKHKQHITWKEPQNSQCIMNYMSYINFSLWMCLSDNQ